MHFFKRNWSDGEKWGMGIVSALIIAGILYFLIPNRENSSDFKDENKTTDHGQEQLGQSVPAVSTEKPIAPFTCQRYISINLSEALRTLESKKVKSEYYEGACIRSPGWSAIAKSVNITDPKNGSHFLLASFQPMSVIGRLYFTGAPPEVRSGEHLLVTGRINRLRPSIIGRNPKTGEKIEFPATVRVLGQAQIVPIIKEEFLKKVFLTENALRGRILEFIAIIYKVPISSINEKMNFENNFPSDKQQKLGQIDIRIIELIIRIEEYAHCEIEDDIAETVYTVGDLLMIATPRCSIP